MTIAQSSGHLPDPPQPPPVVSSSLAAGASLDLPDAPLPAAQNTAPPSQNQIQSPPPSGQQPPQQSAEPSLGDLGFSPTQTQANAQLQARLNKRTHMLKLHQTLGLITLAPMAATVIVAGGAKAKRVRNADGTVTNAVIPPSDANADFHAALGSLTATMYGITAYYAIAAPKIKGVKPKGAIRLHRDLLWIHLPGMVLTPILGGMALSQEENGQKVHGIASAHGAVAWTTVTAYAASAVAVSWPIHLKF
ncbi:MAG TPA: hypothetical protein VHX37_03230 [Acidobacteriaceae bacterium]|jgi:hypothetical protein|nr:hypothetical protein [Acidobacteriaceae bacterium]